MHTKSQNDQRFGKKFVGQPILKQVIGLLDKVSVNSIVKKHHADYYYKTFKAKTQLITTLFGIMSLCESMTEVCLGLRELGVSVTILDLIRPLPKALPV